MGMCSLALGSRCQKGCWAPEYQSCCWAPEYQKCCIDRRTRTDENGRAHALHETSCREALLKAVGSPAWWLRILSGCCAEYIGCFKPRDNADNRLRLRTHRWYDPHHELFEGDSSRYAEGPFYVIQGSVIDGLVRSGLTVRMGGPNEGKLTSLLQNLTAQLDAAFWRSAWSCC